MWQYYLSLEKYWVTQSEYFILANTVALGMVITDGKLIYCHGVAEGIKEKKISTLKYNNRTVYECFNNPFIDEFCSTDFNLPPITFNDRPQTHKRPLYTPDLLPDAIYVASKSSVSTLTNLMFLFNPLLVLTF